MAHTDEGSAWTARDLSERCVQIVTECREGVWIVDSEQRTIFVNAQMAALLGYAVSEMLGRPLSDFVDATDRAHTRDALGVHLEGTAGRLEVRLRGRDHREVWALLSLTPYRDDDRRVRGLLALVTDRTEWRSLELKVQQAQKLESLAMLAGGIAHDFNNLLVGILGNVGLALLDLPKDSSMGPILDDVREAALRAAELTKQMLAYSGKGRFVIERVNVNRLVEDMANLLGSVISKKATLRLSLHPDLPPVEVDAAQIRQIVLNLVTNASDALEGGPGVVALSTGFVDADRSTLAGMYLDDGLPVGRYVFLEVTDSGSGMNAAVQARIFDPFFSTKFTGRGLGLAAVLGILRGHRGAIKVDTRPGKGSTFRVFLPAAPTEPVEVRTVPPSSRAPNQKTILVADDEPTVRSVAGKILERNGYRVICACDGREAVEHYAAHADEIALVLLDMTMPELSGVEVLEEIRRIRPDVRVVLSSGYGEQDTARRVTGPAIFLHKPWLPSELLGALERALEA